VTLANGFLGREDLQLEEDLERELPGILLWALDGLERLRGRGWRFTSSEAGEEAFEELVGMSSPVSAFVDETCTLDPEATVVIDDLWRAWKQWAERNGVHKGNKQQFGKNLHAAFPQVRKWRPRDGGERRWAYRGVRLHQWIEQEDQ
jgi:putative DNA primase/helicase